MGFFYALNFEETERHIALDLSVHLSDRNTCTCFRRATDAILKFHMFVLALKLSIDLFLFLDRTGIVQLCPLFDFIILPYGALLTKYPEIALV